MGHVCLINPPGIKTMSGLQMHTPNPPLGLAYVAAALREAGHRVSVVDAPGEALDQIEPMPGRPDILVQGLTAEQVVGRIPADAEVIGLGCTFSTLWSGARRLLEAVRKARRGVPIVVGGEHASATPESVLRSGAADVCVIGEGEETAGELVDCLTSGGDLSAVRGIAFLRNGELVRTERRERIKPIDSIPWPAWDLFPVEAYIDRQQMNGIHQGRAMPIFATRGCPYRCTFCSSPQMWTTRYSMRDIGDVCDEIEFYMGRYGATDIHFQDLNTIVKRGWIIALCEEISRRGLNITWQLPSGTRAEAIDDEVCQLMAATGCRNVAYAPESGSEAIRRIIDKRLDIDRMLESIRSALRHKLSLSCFFVIGFPEDTDATLKETLRFIRRLAWMGVHDVGVAKFVPYPGSMLFEQLLAAGRVRLDDDFFLSPIESYGRSEALACYCDSLDNRQLHRWMIRLYLNFYLLSFVRRPLRAMMNTARVLLTGRENTRYSKWFRDILKTRRRWKRATCPKGGSREVIGARGSRPDEIVTLPVPEADGQEVLAG